MVVRDGCQDAVSIQKVYPIGKSKSHSQYGSNGERGDLSMYNFYKYGGSHTNLPNVHQVVFRKVNPRWDSLHRVLWHVFSWFCGSRFYEYQIVKNDRVLSTAEVCPKLPIFKFFNRGGITLGLA